MIASKRKRFGVGYKFARLSLVVMFITIQVALAEIPTNLAEFLRLGKPIDCKSDEGVHWRDFFSGYDIHKANQFKVSCSGGKVSLSRFIEIDNDDYRDDYEEASTSKQSTAHDLKTGYFYITLILIVAVIWIYIS